MNVNQKLVEKVSQLLKKKDIKLAVAESCTGGLIGHSLTNVSGSSEYFNRGIISYSNESKVELLDVSNEVLEKYGAVSKPVAREMAEGVRTKSNVDIGISSTGIAGPTGGTEEKPVGLVYLGLSKGEETSVEKYVFSGNRLENKINACESALNLILKKT
ncbi:hypothetical protein AKJ41_05180 [candidate division MSBL1 archaeon SCGC-AAA259O05]|uniref:CinA C-terminal domain-containing protein n=1 Tax=candidate division MSBL1 archaeon SCGC-AAA259O05 TaxID=1698271 RepID=A0A133UZJ9_9EURY|nr:hypothetical protein AKJ41_05180 [candidate division MSBL1 archaeon SCGC-AAA259O05]